MIIVMSKEDLVQQISMIPYNVFCIVDPDTIVYPACIKCILTEESLVHVVPFDSAELLQFVGALREERQGLEGYDYAEADQGSSGEIQSTFIASGEYPDPSDIRPSYISNDNH